MNARAVSWDRSSTTSDNATCSLKPGLKHWLPHLVDEAIPCPPSSEGGQTQLAIAIRREQTARSMAPTLLFITGVLAGLIADCILSRVLSKGRSSGGSGEARLLEERLLKADQGLEQFSRQLEQQSADLQSVQHEAQQARESAAVSSTELKGISRERDALKAAHATALAAIDEPREQLD